MQIDSVSSVGRDGVVEGRCFWEQDLGVLNEVVESVKWLQAIAAAECADEAKPISAKAVILGASPRTYP